VKSLNVIIDQFYPMKESVLNVPSTPDLDFWTVNNVVQPVKHAKHRVDNMSKKTVIVRFALTTARSHRIERNVKKFLAKATVLYLRKVSAMLVHNTHLLMQIKENVNLYSAKKVKFCRKMVNV